MAAFYRPAGDGGLPVAAVHDHRHRFGARLPGSRAAFARPSCRRSSSLCRFLAPPSLRWSCWRCGASRAGRWPTPAPCAAVLSRLLGLLVAISLYFVAVQHATGLYQAERRDVEHFLLFNGGIYSILIWGGFVVLGSVLPMIAAVRPVARWSARRPADRLGPGRARRTVPDIRHPHRRRGFPDGNFPGMQVSSSAFDGVVHPYRPSLPEMALGLGAVGVSGVVLLMAMWVLPLLPDTAGTATPAGE